MSTLQQIVLFVHLVLAAGLIGLVLLQRSEGGALGIGGGGGGLISGRGAADLLARATMALGGLFFVTSLSLSFLAAPAGTERPSAVDALPLEPVEREPAPGDPPLRAAPLPAIEDAPNPEAAVAPSPQTAAERAAPAAGLAPAPAPSPAVTAPPAAPAASRPEAVGDGVGAGVPRPNEGAAPREPESPQSAPGSRERAGPDE